MKNLSRAEDLEELRRRMTALVATDARRWGSMNAGEMVCHVRDAYRLPTAGRQLVPLPRPPMPLALYKWFAFRLPMKWPKGIRTIPELDQRGGGIPPVGFALDRKSLLAALDEFAASRGPYVAHPIFGPMTRAEWMRWGYLHADHHLRQFGR